MAGQAAERAARRKAEKAAESDSLAQPGHEGHHEHVEGNGFICSCGDPQTIGVFSVVPEWSDDPAEMARIRREYDDFFAWIECRYCGKKGVQAADTFGVWPPRAIA
jgi:hypothetical protein